MASLQAYVAAGVPAAALDDLLQEAGRRWFYGERRDAVALAWLEDAAGVAEWDHGRAFDADAELAWWREGDGAFSVRLLTAGDPLPGLSWSEPETWRAAGELQKTLLHGDLDEEDGDGNRPAWSAARIPRRLRYPVPEGEAPDRVALLVQPLHGGDGVAALTRLVGVEGVG